MGKAEKKLQLRKSSGEDEEEEQQLKYPIELSSDEEANEDLSLKIVEKAMLRANSNGGNRYLFLDESNDSGDGGVVVNLSSSSEPDGEVVTEDAKKKKKKEKKKKNNTTEAHDDTVGVAKVEQEAEASKSLESETLFETNPVEKSDNVVLRKLLRGPRYFDPPDSSWGTCYNCGEEGHTTANCTSARRKKPCFLCGSLEHNVKQCKKGKDCFICKNGGHRAKDCPEKAIGGSQNAKICLKCGDSGHDMFSCRNDYSPEDLMEIQCYICKCFGHLCCANNAGAGPREVSCYRCGQSGHTGLACTGLRAETTGMGTPSSCYRCGEEGHFARECATSVKSAKRSRESSNHKEVKKKQKEVKSAPPQDKGKARKRKKAQYEGVASSSKSKKRGGWITEDPGDVSRRKYKANNNGRNSPVTPTNRASRIPFYGAFGVYASSPHSYNSGRRLQFGNSPSNGPPIYYHHPNPASNGSAQYYHHQHRFSVSRFGNSSNDGSRQYWHNNSNYWY